MIMDCLTILALAVNKTAEDTAAKSTVVPVDAFWGTITNLSLLEAMTFIAFGVVCLFYGWRVFKALAVMSFAVIGLVAGLLISQRVGNPNNPLLPVALAVVLGICAIPLMKWAVGILGGVAGAIITAGIWYAAKLPEQYIWAGALTGFVTGGLFSFIVFKIAVMLFTSVGGSILVAAGVLALFHQYSQTSQQVRDLFYGPKWFLAVIILLPALFGIYWQNRFVKKSSEWTV
jgi:hypothetical protein